MRLRDRHRLTLALIVLLAAVVRLVGLTSVPPALGQDEASNGYDGYCLLRTGCDRWGHRWPVLLEAFGRGDYRPALYAYLVAPCAAVVGPKRLALATRLPAALLGVVTVLALYGLVRRLDRPVTGLWAALLLALSPWHIYLSRIGHEAALTPFLVICGLYAAAASHLMTRRAASRRTELSLAPLILGAVMLGASAHAYASMRVFVPTMAAACCFFYRKRFVCLWRGSGNARRLIIAAVIVMAIWSPMIWTACADWDRFSGRALGESLLHKDQGIAVALATIAKQYIDHFSWRWLFTRGDPSPIQSIPGMGQLAWVFLPLMVVGAIRTVRRARRCAGDRVLLAWLLLHPLAAALSHSGAHALRSAVGIGAFSWLAAAGAVELSRWCARLGERPRTACHIVLAIAILTNGAVTMRALTRGSRSRLVRATYQADTLEAVYRIRGIWRNYDRVFLSDRESAARYWRSDEAYVYVLLGLPVEPAEFQRWPKQIEYASDEEPFHTVRSAGPFVFSTSTATLARQFKEHPHERVLVIARPGDLTGGRILDRVIWPGNETRFEIIEVVP